MIGRPKLMYNSPTEQTVEELVPHHLSRRGGRLFWAINKEADPLPRGTTL